MTQDTRSSSRQVTEYLRGIAIAAFVVNHFLNEYVNFSAGGYANGMMSIFFTFQRIKKIFVSSADGNILGKENSANLSSVLDILLVGV